MNAKQLWELIRIVGRLIYLGALLAAWAFLIYGYYVYWPWWKIMETAK